MQGGDNYEFDQNSFEENSIGAQQQQYLQQIQVGGNNHMNSPGSGGRFRSGDNRNSRGQLNWKQLIILYYINFSFLMEIKLNYKSYF